MNLFVTFRYGDLIEQLTFKWLPKHADSQHIAIAIDPVAELGGEYREWGGHRFYFTAPPGVLVYGAEEWGSMSEDSKVLYPFWWQSDEQEDIVCLIVPPGARSSRHLHKKTVERFGCVFNDGETTLCIDGESPRVIYQDLDVDVDQLHNLRRSGRGFSVHLLRMRGPVRFPDRSDHFQQSAAHLLVS